MLWIPQLILRLGNRALHQVLPHQILQLAKFKPQTFALCFRLTIRCSFNAILRSHRSKLFVYQLCHLPLCHRNFLPNYSQLISSCFRGVHSNAISCCLENPSCLITCQILNWLSFEHLHVPKVPLNHCFTPDLFHTRSLCPPLEYALQEFLVHSPVLIKNQYLQLFLHNSLNFLLAQIQMVCLLHLSKFFIQFFLLLLCYSLHSYSLYSLNCTSFNFFGSL